MDTVFVIWRLFGKGNTQGVCLSGVFQVEVFCGLVYGRLLLTFCSAGLLVQVSIANSILIEKCSLLTGVI